MHDTILYLLIGASFGVAMRDQFGMDSRAMWTFNGVQIAAMCYLICTSNMTTLGYVILGVSAVVLWFPYKLWLNWREARKAEA